MPRTCRAAHGALLALAFWTLVSAHPAHAQWRALGLSGREVNRLHARGGFLYACTNSGLHRISLAAPDTVWSLIGFGRESVFDLAALGPDTLLAAKALSGAPADTVSLFRSTDAGASWEPFQNGFGTGGNRQARRLLALAGAPGTILAVGNRIEKSSDEGLSWRVVAQGFAVNALEQAPGDPRLLWAGGETVIFWPFVLKSTDAGETWMQINLFAGGDNAVDAIAGHPTDPSVVFLGMEGRVMKSEDGGTNWWTMTSPNPTIYTFGMAFRPFLPLKLYAAGASFIPDLRGVVFYQSYDGGLSWPAVTYPAYAGYGVSHLLPVIGGTDETMYVATWNGVYRYTQIPVGVPVSEGAHGIALRCLPNPFFGAMELEFALPSAQRVSLLVADTRGRIVASLVNGVLGAGLHRVPWDAKGVGGGIYFCRLRAGDRVQSLKILHLP